MPPAARLRLVNERGEGAQGDEMYLDLPGEDGALALRDALSPFVARFLHPDYLSAYPEEAADNETHEDEARADTRSEWVAWLRDSVGVNVVPRVKRAHGRLARVPIGGRRLDRLYLRRGALARADQALKLPFVPVDDPEDHGWDFLELLGVGMRLDAVSDGHSAPPIRDQR
ncbi:hypothetical protein BJY52DRAFT_1226166 [Lactarius psammicola]|nr:hypothetical protein BJY52DRAFT_1226166 [Lactarius psammicola]